MKIQFIIPLALFLVFSSCVHQEDSSEQDIFKRKIELDGQNNFRDLGNYSTTNGSKIKEGVLFRSGTFSKLSEPDKNIIKELGINTVVNFLSEEEIAARGADNLPDGVRSVYLPISGDNDEASAVLKARQTGDFTEVPIELNYNMHKILPEVGKESYLGLLRVLADSSSYPVVFHCSHGVHRTGTAAALILSLLDIPWSQIETDYLLSNKYRHQENLLRINQLDSLARVSAPHLDFNKNRENIEAFYLLKSDYILGTKEYIEARYGSFDTYFEDLGLSKDELLQIRQNLIEK